MIFFRTFLFFLFSTMVVHATEVPTEHPVVEETSEFRVALVHGAKVLLGIIGLCYGAFWMQNYLEAWHTDPTKSFSQQARDKELKRLDRLKCVAVGHAMKLGLRRTTTDVEFLTKELLKATYDQQLKPLRLRQHNNSGVVKEMAALRKSYEWLLRYLKELS